jgi:anti-sigma factor RsiW
MKCERIQELILTDYIDGRMTPRAKDGLEKHLMTCHDCLEFARVAKATAVEPFEKGTREKTPESVWMNIKEELLSQEEHGATSWLDRLKEVFHPQFAFPRPVAVFAGMCFVVMAVTLVQFSNINRIPVQMAADQDEVEYMAALSVRSDIPTSGYGTSVEQYFL